MSVFAARMNPSSSDWLSLGDSRYGNELRHHQHQMQQQQQLLPAASSPRHVNPPATFRDTHYAGIIVKPDPDSVYHQRNGEPPLSVDESYRVAAARALSQRPVWQTSPNSYHLATHESRRPPSGLIDNSLGWPIDRQRFPDSPRDVAAVTSRPSIEEGEYRRSSDKEDFISERLSFHGGGRSPASDAGHGHWNRDNELRPQSPRPRLDSAVSDPYRTAPGRHRTSDVGGSVHLERSRESDDSEPGHYRPRQLLADFYRTRERAEPQRDTREERSEDGGGVGVEDRRWTKASSTYDGSPPADRESIEEANFYNGRRQTWPFASLQDHHHTIPAGRRRHPHSASAPGQYFDQVDQSLGRQQAAVAAAAAASPIVQLIQRYDQHGFTSSTDAVPPTSTSSGARADWVPLPWQSAITSDAAAAAVDSNSTSEMSASMSESGEFGKTYSCHICSYIGESKMEFDAHMRLHFDHRCPFCDYSSRTEGRLRCHIKTFHADGGLATTTGQVPLVADQTASKRKPKIITCQKCGFKAKEKEELWIHRRQQHMAADKVLECPRCPFATELRHHLEYHLRSHYGSRPYKCDKCTYRCYNQSMLNSHAKSHTNVYQFRCADCQFAAKYCHSLKVHLRQNPTHRAAPVLNEDGSVPTDGSGDFEVMSRRGRPRGPRASRRTTGARSRLSRLDMAQLPALSMPMSTSADTVRAVAPPAQYVADNARTQFSVMPNLFASSDDSRLSSSSPAMMDTAAGRMLQSEMRLLPTTAFGEFVAAGQASRHAGPFQTVSSPAAAAAQYQMRSGESARQIDTAAPYSSATPPFLPVHMEVFESSEHVGGQHPIRSYSPATCADRPLRPSVQSAVLAPASNYDDYAVAVVSPTMPEPEPAALPLDLTAPKSRADDDEPPSIRPEVSDRSSDDVTVYRRRRHYESWSRAHSGASRPQSDDPAARNRKDSDQSDSGASAAGDVKPDVAFAHARPEADNFSEPEPERAGPPAKRTRVSESLEESGRAEMESGSPASGAERSLGGGRYQCSHCEIEFFGSRVLHAMHMAFHGPADPFQCSQCGVTTADRVEFFLHLARVAHA